MRGLETGLDPPATSNQEIVDETIPTHVRRCGCLDALDGIGYPAIA